MKKKELNTLVKLLHQASKLEISLLDSYLYTASSIKSLPEEFETLSNGKPNLRKSIQFEKARNWKQKILTTSHEEMLHLHYVQCLLRALDKSPRFKLPERIQKNEGKAGWIIPNWDIYTPTNTDSAGTKIPLEGLTENQIKNFILFESTDALQDEHPFGEKMQVVFKRIYAFELEIHVESILYNIPDEERRNELKSELLDIYMNQLPSEDDIPKLVRKLQAESFAGIEDYVRFQSIGDFYMKGILPLYEQAFDFGEVKNSNRRFNNELLGPDAAEGFLPVGPVYRTKNYTAETAGNTSNPLRYFKNVRSIVEEIVEEGEGMTNFDESVEALFAKIDEIGTRAYLEAMKKDKAGARNPNYTTPKWLANGELVRKSHLYKFIEIYMDMQHEKDLSVKAGVDFSPTRPHIAVDIKNHAIAKMIDEMPLHFNACYMVMLLWLGRIYEVKEWESDKDERLAIEMIATWPLMSLAVRPFLELMSFFPIDMENLYRLEPEGLPNLPVEALQLFEYFDNEQRTEKINKHIDYLALRVLSNAAEWATEQVSVVETHLKDDYQKGMVVTRLRGLSKLGEFEKQFPFRVHGGYSNQMPDLTYQQEHPDGNAYEENPGSMSGSVFENSLVLKMRFGGFGLVQLSTDPDPPTDESGCTGTHMLHAADENRVFDRALVWQNTNPEKNILREPRAKLPEIGINLVDLELQIPSVGGAQAGFVPIQTMSSSGAVQASGVQQELEVTGMNTLAHFSNKEIVGENANIRFDLLEKDGIRPLLYGDNHLVSKDGEPIDPFIISVMDNDYNKLFTREIYNDGLSMEAMNPLQRLMTSRWPSGFDNIGNIPEWLLDHLPESSRKLLELGPGDISAAYLGKRAQVLYNAMEGTLKVKEKTQTWFDNLISFAARLKLITFPRGTTVAWLRFLLHYGHTVSGEYTQGVIKNPIKELIAKRLNLDIDFEPQKVKSRTDSNARWLLKYTQGVMDTDAISEMVFGELYVPVTIKPNRKPYKSGMEWNFSPGMMKAVTIYTCNFDKPFWATFDIQGKTRKTRLQDGTLINETLIKATKTGYTYKAEGVPGISNYQGEFEAKEQKDGSVILNLNVQFDYDTADHFLYMTTVVGGYYNACNLALEKEFLPKQK